MSTKRSSLNKIKFVILGDIDVGKTALVTRFMFDSFNPQYQATVGIDMKSKTMYSDGRAFRLQFWDTAGQERFKSLIPSYYRNVNVAVVVYDITKRNSFDESAKWIDDVRIERGEDVIIMLVGNKLDLTSQREVSTEEGEQKAKELNILFIETSAKTDVNIKELFDRVIEAVIPTIETDIVNEPQTDINDNHVILQRQAIADDTMERGECWCNLFGKKK